MNRMIKRVAALVLSSLLFTTTVFASYALGDELHCYSIPLADGALMTTQLFWSNSKSNLRTENYITYTPDSSLSPQVSYGNSVLDKQTVAAMATALETNGQRVLSGINGDYFVVATGNPLGIVVTDGILRSSASYLSAIGFQGDGSAIIGKPELSITANFSECSLKVEALNKIRSSTSGFNLLTQDFGATTKNSQAGVDVILSPVLDNLGESVTTENDQTLIQSDTVKIGSRVSCVVEEVLQSTGSINIPEGKLVMTINNNSGEFLLSTLSALVPGDTVDIDITSSDPAWNTVDCAIGALYRILTDGTVNSDLDDTAAPRTAIGTKADGTVIFYTIDGRQSGLSIGASMTQVAKRLLELGCVDAVCLDGGGSTTMGTTNPDSNGFSVINSPSDGYQRKVTDALFLVSNLSPSGTPDRLYVQPNNRVLLSDATTSCTASFVDTNWFPVSDSESLSWSAKNGSITQDGIYTAPTSGGEDEITVTSSSGIMGSTTVTVFQAPTSIRLTNERSEKTVRSLDLTAKETIDLRASAFYKMIPLTAEDTNFTWSVTPDSLGTITSDGSFTSGTTNATGHIQVSAGSYTETVPVTVSVDAHFNLLESFEASPLATFTETDTCQLSQNTAADQVRFGKQSLQVDYTLSSELASMNTTLSVPNQDGFLSLWIYGDNSENELTVTCQNDAGTETSVPVGTLNFTGWKRLSIALPADTVCISELSISGATSSGRIWFDQIVSSNQNIPDTTAPKISLSIADSQLRATITDASGALFSQSQVSATLDGKPLAVSFTQASGTLTATLPDLSPSLHRITVTATDFSGNIGRASYTIPASDESVSSFVDVSEHWSAPYTDYLADLGIINGVNTDDGLYFYPDRSITRGDFALMTARWMGLTLEEYADVSLPFADQDAIPSWSSNAVKAMYELGIMKGSQSQQGLTINATASITRAEAMTILGRIQTKGYPLSSLSDFQDEALVPTWANGYLASLVGQGVVSGYEGFLRPTDSVSRAELAKMLVTIW